MPCSSFLEYTVRGWNAAIIFEKNKIIYSPRRSLPSKLYLHKVLFEIDWDSWCSRWTIVEFSLFDYIRFIPIGKIKLYEL